MANEVEPLVIWLLTIFLGLFSPGMFVFFLLVYRRVLNTSPSIANNFYSVDYLFLLLVGSSVE